MSEARLGFFHKLAAYFERKFKQSKVKNLDICLIPDIAEISSQLSSSVEQMETIGLSQISTLNTSFDFCITAGLSDFADPVIRSVVAESITTSIQSSQLELYNRNPVRSFSTGIISHVSDLFREFSFDPKLIYSTKIKSAPQIRISTNVYGLFPSISCKTTENLLYIRGFQVRRKPALIFFIPETEQLEYWKKAIIQTKLDPKELKIIGIYKNIPYNYVTNIKVDYSTGSISYYYKGGTSRADIMLNDIAIFQDLDKNKALMVKM